MGRNKNVLDIESTGSACKSCVLVKKIYEKTLWVAKSENIWKHENIKFLRLWKRRSKPKGKNDKNDEEDRILIFLNT